VVKPLRWVGLLGLATALLLGLLLGVRGRTAQAGLRLEVSLEKIPADGFSSVLVRVEATNGKIPPLKELKLDVIEGARRARIESVTAGAGVAAVVVRVGVLPGPVVIEASATGFSPARVELKTSLAASDGYGDGTPDFLRLEETDQEAFRRWFTFLAEMPFVQPPGRAPAEVNDCGALLRFAYREALREHTSVWANELGLEGTPPGPSVEKYQYPYTPLGANLFRVQPGRFVAPDLSGGAFAQFADAETLRQLNAHFVSRDLSQARPGDLLFYRQLSQDLPYHAMVFLGASHFEEGGEPYIVYHTGPLEGSKGEIRRPSVAELRNHPSPRWRPLPGNPNFLGVYRWNILREAD